MKGQDRDHRALLAEKVRTRGIDYRELIAEAAQAKGMDNPAPAIERFETELLTEQAVIDGRDPEQAIARFREVLLTLEEKRIVGAECQRRKLELSRHYDLHLKSIPLPEGITPLPRRELKRRWGIEKTEQEEANRSVSILTNEACRLLGAPLLIDPTRRRRAPKGGGDDA